MSSAIYNLQSLSGSVLYDGILINGVANFFQSSKPTTRVDGSALQIGDLWKKTGQDIAEWNGTYWVGPLQTSNSMVPASLVVFTISATGTAGYLQIVTEVDYKILLQKITYSISINGTNDATNNWTIQPQIYGGKTGGNYQTSIGTAVDTFTDWALINETNFVSKDFVFNTVLDFPTIGGARDIRHTFTKNGSAGVLSVGAASAFYRLIYG